jgi:Integrase core domain
MTEIMKPQVKAHARSFEALRVRRGLPVRRDHSHPLGGAGAEDEFDHGAMDRSCRRELLDRTLIWSQRHLMIVLREYEDFYNTHRPHRALSQAAPLRALPDCVTDLDQFRVQRRDRAGGILHEYHLVA